MRDAVDSNRMAQNQVAQNSTNNDSQGRKGFDTSAILPTQQPDASTAGIFTSKQGRYGDDLTVESSNAQNSEEAELDASMAQNQQSDIFGGLMDQIGTEHNEVIEKSIESSEDDEVAILDASTPWQSRVQDDESNAEQSQDDEWQEVPGSGGSLFGFDLDLGDLGDSQDSDEPLKETPFDVFDSEEINNESVKKVPLESVGMFGSLVGRMRDAPARSIQNPDDYYVANDVDGAELWVAKDSDLIDESNDDDLEGDGTVILYDETGLMDEEFDSNEITDENIYQEIENSNTESGIVTNAEMKKFSILVDALQTALLAPQEADGTIDRRKLIDALTSLRQPKVGERIDHPLNPSVLSNLSPHEAVVVATANERKYSPSDIELLQELKIKRARLSQISNRLHKGGVLNVRKVGKSRMFTLTQSARAQLTAWNMMGGES